MNKNEQSAGTAADKRTTAESGTSASLEQNGLLSAALTHEEGNKLIAMFVGRYKKVSDIETDEDPIVIDIEYDGFSGSEISRKTRPFSYSDLKYHYSWDWLIPVVQKITNLGWQFQLNSYGISNSAEFIKLDSFIRNTSWSTPLLATYNVVIDFIKWYNDSTATVGSR